MLLIFCVLIYLDCTYSVKNYADKWLTIEASEVVLNISYLFLNSRMWSRIKTLNKVLRMASPWLDACSGKSDRMMTTLLLPEQYHIWHHIGCCSGSYCIDKYAHYCDHKFSRGSHMSSSLAIPMIRCKSRCYVAVAIHLRTPSPAFVTLTEFFRAKLEVVV